MNLTPGSVTVIPNAAPAAKGRTRRNTEHCKLLFVGKLEAHKGVHILVDMLRRYPSLSVEMTFVGAGSLVDGLRRLASTDHRVRLPGSLSVSELQEEYLRAKWLLIPSIWPENAPMVAFEALATGLPLILSPAGGLPELEEETGAAVIARGFDPEDWMKILLNVIADDFDIEPLSRSALGYSNRATLEQMGSRYMEVFDRARSEMTPQE